MNDLDQLAIAVLTLVFGAVMLVSGLLYVDNRVAMRSATNRHAAQNNTML